MKLISWLLTPRRDGGQTRNLNKVCWWLALLSLHRTQTCVLRYLNLLPGRRKTAGVFCSSPHGERRTQGQVTAKGYLAQGTGSCSQAWV